jgi:hypothetical protein
MKLVRSSRLAALLFAKNCLEDADGSVCDETGRGANDQPVNQGIPRSCVTVRPLLEGAFVARPCRRDAEDPRREKSRTPFWSVNDEMLDWVLSRIGGVAMDYP